MSPWVVAERAESQRDDARHAKRLAALLTRLGEQPVRSIPSACRGWTETVAAYRLLDNPRVGVDEILSGHRQATVERLRRQEVAWLVQETSFLNYGPRQAKTGMGTVQATVREEYLWQATVAFTPERVKLGGLGAKLWQRPEEPVAPERARKPSEEQESDRWWEGEALACEGQQTCPQPVGVSVADCEGDIQEWFLAAMNRPAEEGAEFLLRAKGNRRLAQGAQPEYVWEERRAARPLGKSPFRLSRQADRPSRRVTLTVTAQPVTFHGARRPGGRLPSVRGGAGSAKEVKPPKGEAPIAWLLRTRVPVEHCAGACTVRQW